MRFKLLLAHYSCLRSFVPFILRTYVFVYVSMYATIFFFPILICIEFSLHGIVMVIHTIIRRNCYFFLVRQKRALFKCVWVWNAKKRMRTHCTDSNRVRGKTDKFVFPQYVWFFSLHQSIWSEQVTYRAHELIL